MRRNIAAKPREAGDLPFEKLREVLGKIYPEDMADDLMEKLSRQLEEQEWEG